MIKKTKLLFAWDEDKEETFLEEQALKGLHLVNAYPFRYHFEEGQPKHVSYQFDFPSFDLQTSGEDEYLQIYQDDGWEHVTCVGGWYFFRKEYEVGQEKPLIFSDRSSYTNKLKRLIVFLLITGFPLYNAAFIMPTAISSSAEAGSFYRVFTFILYPIALLHVYAIVRLGKRYYDEKRR